MPARYGRDFGPRGLSYAAYQPTSRERQVRVGNTTLTVRQGDLTTASSQALIVPINSYYDWGGRVDKAIDYRAGGLDTELNGFHKQLFEYLVTHNAKDGDIFFAERTPKISPDFIPERVLFVIDNITKSNTARPLNEIVAAGLEAAFQRGYTHVTMPLMRTGAVKGKMEIIEEEVARAMAEGVKTVALKHNSAPMHAEILIYGDPDGSRSDTVIKEVEKVFGGPEPLRYT